MSDRRALGREFEAAAARLLEDAKLVVLARNVNCRHGEIDIVAREGEVLVFVEVRYRGAGAVVDAIDSIDARKRARIVAAARWYLAEHPKLARLSCRFDVIAFDGAPGEGKPQWLRDAFRVDE